VPKREENPSPIPQLVKNCAKCWKNTSASPLFQERNAAEIDRWVGSGWFGFFRSGDGFDRPSSAPFPPAFAMRFLLLTSPHLTVLPFLRAPSLPNNQLTREFSPPRQILASGPKSAAFLSRSAPSN